MPASKAVYGAAGEVMLRQVVCCLKGASVCRILMPGLARKRINGSDDSEWVPSFGLHGGWVQEAKEVPFVEI